MSHTNSTTYYGLPQFVTTDKPAWLTDVNTAFSAIDTGIHNAKGAADAAQGDATQALSDAGYALSTANTANGKGTGAIASISENFESTNTYAVGDIVMYNNLLYRCIAAITTPGDWTGSANWNRVTLDTLNVEQNTIINSISNSISVHNPSPAYNITKTTGAWSVTNVQAKRSGNIVMLDITIKGSGVSVGAGENGFVGQISTGALPIYATESLRHRGSNIIIELRIDNTGAVTLTVINNSSTLGSTETMTFDCMFMIS